MFNETSGIIKALVSVLFFPMYYQGALVGFAWGAGDPAWMLAGKRALVLLPAAAVVVASWATIAGIVTIPVRMRRQEFATTLFLTWWDLGKSILAFWAGSVRFGVELAATAVGLARMVVLAVWAAFYDVLLMPFHVLARAGRSLVGSSVPWIAVCLTLSWCLVETTIFTYVMSPLVIDTFSNITGETLSATFVRIPLFLFLFFVVLGSYAVLSTFVGAIKSRSASSIAGIGGVELVVLFVEVVFLYREFVDSFVPWFAQYSQNFELGVFWTLAISCFVWFGIRSLSWFLFASHGTPVIMAVIQRRGVETDQRASAPESRTRSSVVPAVRPTDGASMGAGRDAEVAANEGALGRPEPAIASGISSDDA